MFPKDRFKISLTFGTSLSICSLKLAFFLGISMRLLRSRRWHIATANQKQKRQQPNWNENSKESAWDSTKKYPAHNIIKTKKTAHFKCLPLVLYIIFQYIHLSHFINIFQSIHCIFQQILHSPSLIYPFALQLQGVPHKKTSSSNCCLLGEAAGQDVVSSLVLSFLVSTGALINFISICKFAIITIISCEYLTIPNADALHLRLRLHLQLRLRVSTANSSFASVSKCIQRMRRGDNEIFNSIKRHSHSTSHRTLPILALAEISAWIFHSIYTWPGTLALFVPLALPGLAWSEGAAN